jgi:hypothetical protein
MLLESLSLTFEGQSELLIPSTGYHPFRLCAETHDITPAGGPVELTNEGHEDGDDACTWNVVFSIPIPGWLPASAAFGDELDGAPAGVSYALYASAKLSTIEDAASPRSFFSFATLCSALTSRARTVHAPRREIAVARVEEVPALSAPASGSLFERITYAATPLAHCAPQDRDASCIPLDVLQKLRFLAQVPDHVAIGEESAVPVTLKVAAEGMSEDTCARFQITGFTADIEQSEKYRYERSALVHRACALTVASSSSCPSIYSTAYPVPPRAQQANRVPLRNPHPLHALYDMSVCVSGDAGHSSTRAFSLRAADKSGEYALAGSPYVFARDTDAAFADVTDDATRSFGVAFALPFVPQVEDEARLRAKELSRLGWTAAHRLRATSDGPHLSVRHSLRVSLQCVWDAAPAADGGPPQQIRERLDFVTPLSFVHVRAAPVVCPPSPEHLAALISPISPVACSPLDLAPSMPYADSKPFGPLPPYSQLFHSNGDRRIEYDLPKYEALPTTDTILFF